MNEDVSDVYNAYMVPEVLPETLTVPHFLSLFDFSSWNSCCYLANALLFFQVCDSMFFCVGLLTLEGAQELPGRTAGATEPLVPPQEFHI